MVWSSFLVPWRAALYILAMIAVGFHLSHAIQSLFQTLGVTHKRYTAAIRKISIVLGVVVAVGFSLVPIYVNIVGMQ
jgi:succinate dehydrogenase / fumarate reductase cytochrome b subunit